MAEVLTVVGLFVLRLGVPLLIMAAIGYALHRLDAKWEKEARVRMEAPHVQEAIEAELKALKPARPCWEQKGCTEKQRAQCPASKARDVPCWVAQLRAMGRLPAACQDCELFIVSATA